MDQPTRDESGRPRDYRTIAIIAFLVALSVNGAVIGWAFWLAAQRPDVGLSKPVVSSQTELCPGETLDYRFNLSVSKAASVDLYTSVERTVPTDRVSYTRLQQFTFNSATDLAITRNWVLPPTYLDPVSGMEIGWQPGEYVQRTSATIVGGRDDPVVIEVPFEVRLGCVLSMGH
jgi:hypothetical protein